MSKKHKKVCRVWNYMEDSVILISAFTGYVSISAFAFLVGISIGITSSAVGVNICVITAGIKKYKSINRKQRKSQDKIVLLAKSKLKSIEVWIFKILIYSNISHEEFVLINNALKNFMIWKKKPKILMINKLYIKQCCLNV